MAWTFTISIPDDIKEDLVAAYAYIYNYEKNSAGLTKKEFALTIEKQHIRDIYKSYKVKIFNRNKTTTITNANAATESITVS